MPQENRKTVYLHGYLYYAKVLGTPRPNYDGDAREWTFEFEPDDEAIATLTEHGLADRLKDGRKKDGTMRKNYEGRKPFIILRRGEFKTTGERNEHIRVVDALNQDWSSRVKLGNGTEADVKVQIVDWGSRKKKGIYPLAMRVLELVPYIPQEFDELPPDNPHVQSAKARDAEFRRDFGLDDPEELQEDDTVETLPEEKTEEPEPEQEPTSAGPTTGESELDDEVPV